MVFFMYFCTKITDMRKIWLFILIVIFLTSCRTVRYIDRSIIDSTEIEVPITNTKIEYKDRFLHDSIYIHDSIFTLIKGDTVYIYRNKETNHLINKIDTIVKIDTIKVPVEITKTVTKTETQIKEINKLYWWQKIFMYFGLIVFISGIVFPIIKIKKFF